MEKDIRLRDIGEAGILARIFERLPAEGAGILVGSGDDAAALVGSGDDAVVFASDAMVENVHFDLAFMTPADVGWRLTCANLSDLAAMGATPRWATLALALPSVDANWLAAFMRGFMRLARAHDVDLIGGDTTRGPLNLCVQIMGEVPAGKALRRDGARVGDDVWVSGTLGDAALAVAAGNKQMALNKQQRRTASMRLDRPMPRLALGAALRGVAHSAIDVSDGLLADLTHICERSRVAAVIAFDALPRSALLRKLSSHAMAQRALLAGGDDYELCFTAAVSKRAAVRRAGARSRTTVTRIGSVVRAPAGAVGVAVVDASGLPMRIVHRGFDHFG